MAGFQFPQLDATTRGRMLEEHQLDVDTDRLYVGKRLNDHGEAVYRRALPESLRDHNPEQLQAQLEPVPGDLWISATIAVNGRRSTTPVTAAQTLADGEFNRFYMRAICLRALAEGNGQVRVRRFKEVANPRADRFVQVDDGDELDAHVVLEDIRAHPGDETELGMPRGPNSGLSLEFDPAIGEP